MEVPSPPRRSTFGMTELLHGDGAQLGPRDVGGRELVAVVVLDDSHALKWPPAHHLATNALGSPDAVWRTVWRC